MKDDLGSMKIKDAIKLFHFRTPAPPKKILNPDRKGSDWETDSWSWS